MTRVPAAREVLLPRAEAEDLRQAFAPLEARAVAPDRISLRNHVLTADIGAFEIERGAAQRLRFDVVVEVAAAPAGDDVDRILSYDRIAEAIAAELSRARVNLLETLAEGVAARLLAEPQAGRVFVRIEKLDRGPGDLGVEIVRSGAPAAPAPPPPVPAPLIVFLAESALSSPDLVGHLAALSGRPAVLAVGLPPGPLPDAGGEAGRRIALLAIEQNAWRLQARVPCIDVAATRTEIDWALRRGRRVVWAPSRLVLEAAVPPAGGPLALAAWLGAAFGATGMLILGDPPEEALPAALPVEIRPL